MVTFREPETDCWPIRFWFPAPARPPRTTLRCFSGRFFCHYLIVLLFAFILAFASSNVGTLHEVPFNERGTKCGRLRKRSRVIGYQNHDLSRPTVRLIDAGPVTARKPCCRVRKRRGPRNPPIWEEKFDRRTMGERAASCAAPEFTVARQATEWVLPNREARKLNRTLISVDVFVDPFPAAQVHHIFPIHARCWPCHQRRRRKSHPPTILSLPVGLRHTGMQALIRS